jgi:8-oxo-dGTP pyrophosphatase MutT (NUDIX family)
MPGRPRFRVGVKGVIFRDKRVLLLRRRDDLALHPGLWDLPGGGLEEGESLEDALAREVREETGFRVTVAGPVHAWTVLNTLRSGESFPGVLICFECRSSATRPPQLDSSEHCEFAWVGRRTLPGYHGLPDQFAAIRKAYSMREGANARLASRCRGVSDVPPPNRTEPEHQCVARPRGRSSEAHPRLTVPTRVAACLCRGPLAHSHRSAQPPESAQGVTGEAVGWIFWPGYALGRVRRRI